MRLPYPQYAFRYMHGLVLVFSGDTVPLYIEFGGNCRYISFTGNVFFRGKIINARLKVTTNCQVML